MLGKNVTQNINLSAINIMIISIITPTYNSEKTIARNAESVLAQDYENYVHIIIDNLSSDRTLEIISDLYEKAGKTDKLKVISEPDKGISDAFNKGISYSGGDIIGILNSDDYYYSPDVLSRTCSAFSSPDILFTHGDMYFEDEIYGSNVRRPLLTPARLAMPYNHPTMFFRREVYEKYGGFDLNFRYAMDYELVCRLESRIPGFAAKGYYIKGGPLVYVKSGGASWEHEGRAIREIKPALRNNSLWQADSSRAYYMRLGRNILKKYMSMAGLESAVKIWRRWKWKN